MRLTAVKTSVTSSQSLTIRSLKRFNDNTIAIDGNFSQVSSIF